MKAPERPTITRKVSYRSNDIDDEQEGVVINNNSMSMSDEERFPALLAMSPSSRVQVPSEITQQREFPQSAIQDHVNAILLNQKNILRKMSDEGKFCKAAINLLPAPTP